MDIHPEIPEGINVSKTHPLADFGLMLVGAIGLVLAIILAAQLLAGYLVRYIPFEMEARLFDDFFAGDLVFESESSAFGNIFGFC